MTKKCGSGHGTCKCSSKKSDVKIKIDEKDMKIAELTESLKRLQAEFENYKRRVEKEQKDFSEYACGDFIKKFLPVLDSFELSLKNLDGKETQVTKGLKLIYSQFFDVLESFGLRKIECVGKKFDPYSHEVLLSEKSDDDSDVVLEELHVGYMLKDKVLRHSKVKVSK
ncbi:nucleotide exchange factor GrpE [Candidatus Woesearchaeota archaeon]|jgi:molecular chaperone GrpE|nr:nucleotide exchange factor GrpE [Candidatus Woesearchaeota archaeon]MBT3536977.1 nucleotide exchange factor GrpE [Candidatus Woesearchaeota archaeon]MBT4697587.1 nucleotide exchange factor GrpE [Candidatus Woesearchaeota archaeon]MBT4717701.1 nucleotide exchange factor GrpE [Candidatus Woesearchaeota archaeon]MBT7106713.1 nucleotide exchange factor GrpE [Candidatus Woesearchaeota archaeon]